MTDCRARIAPRWQATNRRHVLRGQCGTRARTRMRPRLLSGVRSGARGIQRSRPAANWRSAAARACWRGTPSTNVSLRNQIQRARGRMELIDEAIAAWSQRMDDHPGDVLRNADGIFQRLAGQRRDCQQSDGTRSCQPGRAGAVPNYPGVSMIWTVVPGLPGSRLMEAPREPLVNCSMRMTGDWVPGEVSFQPFAVISFR